MTTASTTPPSRPTIDKDRLFSDLGYTPHQGQALVHRSRATRRVVACGVRWGKTRCAAMDGLAAALEPRERSVGWVVAPTYDLADRVYREIVYLVRNQLRHRLVSMREHEKKLVIRNLSGGLSEIRAKSADNPVSLLGEGLDWLVVDEASRLPAHVWYGHLSQRLLDKKGWALLISTPKGKNWFYDLYRRGQADDPDVASWNFPSRANPLLDPAAIETERARIPHRTFLQEYEAQFIEGSGAVFRGVRDCATGELGTFNPRDNYRAGLDLARVEDFTVLVIVNTRREVVHVDRFARIDWATQIARVVAASERFQRPMMQVDSTGVGEPVFEALRGAGVGVRAYPLTAQSKTALINNLILMIERRDLVLPKAELWPEGIDELESFEYSVSEMGHVRTSAPSGAHDDCVIALALAAWQLPRATSSFVLA